MEVVAFKGLARGDDRQLVNGIMTFEIGVRGVFGRALMARATLGLMDERDRTVISSCVCVMIGLI